jgi:hypothetical protein
VSMELVLDFSLLWNVTNVPFFFFFRNQLLDLKFQLEIQEL